MKKIMLLGLFLLSSTLAFDANSSFDVSQRCKLSYEKGQIFTENASWCNSFVNIRAKSILLFHHDKWCPDTSWSARKWRITFQVFALIGNKERTVDDVIFEILNTKHSCPTEVI